MYWCVLVCTGVYWCVLCVVCCVLCVVCCVLCVVQMMKNAPCLARVAPKMHLIGWGSKLPASPPPGTRRPSGWSAKKARKTCEKPHPHRHRHKVRNSTNRPIFSTTCNCGNSAVSATTCDCGACTTNTTGTSTTFQKYCNCEISMVWAINLHNFLHCLNHRASVVDNGGHVNNLS